jgi:hypothetical protein
MVELVTPSIIAVIRVPPDAKLVAKPAFVSVAIRPVTNPFVEEYTAAVSAEANANFRFQIMSVASKARIADGCVLLKSIFANTSFHVIV